VQSVTAKRVYIETTIPSFYHTLRTDAESIARMRWTRQWWNEYARWFHLTSSAAVVDELRRGSGPKTQDRVSLLQNVTLLPVTDEVQEIAEIYVNRLVMPKDPAGDALHLAIASFHRVDALLTWNCKHIANANKIDHIRRVNYQIGLPTPTLATPLNYLGGDD